MIAKEQRGKEFWPVSPPRCFPGGIENIIPFLVLTEFDAIIVFKLKRFDVEFCIRQTLFMFQLRRWDESSKSSHQIDNLV